MRSFFIASVQPSSPPLKKLLAQKNTLTVVVVAHSESNVCSLSGFQSGELGTYIYLKMTLGFKRGRNSTKVRRRDEKERRWKKISQKFCASMKGEGWYKVSDWLSERDLRAFLLFGLVFFYNCDQLKFMNIFHGTVPRSVFFSFLLQNGACRKRKRKQNKMATAG